MTKYDQLKKQLAKGDWSGYIRTPSDEEAVRQGCYFSLSHAQHVEEFFRTYLRHAVGRFLDKPFELLDWQKYDLVYPLFGWLRPDGTRRFRRAFVFIAKKNGKTTLAAAILLYMLVADGEEASECFSAGKSRAQAGMIFKAAHRMVRKSPQLRSRIRAVPNLKRLVWPAKDCVYQALSADAGVAEGLDASCIVLDELHVWPNWELYDSLQYAGTARSQPLLIIITTAGKEKQGVCYEEYKTAKDIATGQTVNPEYFSLIYEAEEADDWEDPAIWRKANPSLGVTIDETVFRQEQSASKVSLGKQNTFRRYRLNQWISIHGDTWVPVEAWDACPRIKAEDLLNQECFVGMDLATTTDLCAVSLVFPRPEGRVAVLQLYWAPEEAATRRERENRTRLTTWAMSGPPGSDRKWIEMTEGNSTSFGRIRYRMNQLSQIYKVRAVLIDQREAIDPHQKYLRIKLNRRVPKTQTEVRAMAHGTNSAGGYTVGESAMQQIEAALLFHGSVRQHATVLRTEEGGQLPFPTNDDTANEGRLLTEGVQATETNLTIGRTVLDSYRDRAASHTDSSSHQPSVDRDGIQIIP